MERTEIKIFSPATVANVSCGFDVMGFCLDNVGDEMVIRKVDKKGIHITHIEGFDLPYKTELNVAGVSALAMYNALDLDFGFDIEIYKNIDIKTAYTEDLKELREALVKAGGFE